MIITASQNPRIKYIRKLSQRGFRERERKLLVEGIRLVEEALASNWRAESFIYTLEAVQSERGARLLAEAEVKCRHILPVTPAIMAEISDTETPQGVMAVLWQPDYALADVLPPGQSSLVVVVDGVQDPGNLGTIVRSADAAGATGVILLKGTVDIYNPKTLRSTMGSLFHLPVVPAEDVPAALKYLTSAGITLIVGDPADGAPVYDINLKVPVGLVVGNEGTGPGNGVLQFEYVKVTIPMPGRAESLNVAMATSILLYEAVRQRA